MSDQFIDYKMHQLTSQVDRMTFAIDKLCSRIELLELDLQDRKLKKKIIGFLFTLYPVVMLVLTFSINIDQTKINDFIKNYANIIEHE